MTPAKALETLREYFPLSGQWNVVLRCEIRSYADLLGDGLPHTGTSYEAAAWRVQDSTRNHMIETADTVREVVAKITKGREKPGQPDLSEAGVFFAEAQPEAKV